MRIPASRDIRRAVESLPWTLIGIGAVAMIPWAPFVLDLRDALDRLAFILSTVSQ